MKEEWAIAELDKFIEMTVMKNESSSSGGMVYFSSKNRTAAPDTEVTKLAQIVEHIFDEVISAWRTEIDNSPNNRWTRHREAALRAREQLLRAQEVRDNLGESAPELSAAELHPWIWSGAQSLWQSGHYREAVEAALKKLNAETQNKVGRRDVSETKLFRESYSSDDPAPGRPRLRRMHNDGSDTYVSMQRGAMSLAEGIYAGIRNPLSHEAEHELSEQEALEYLAAVSVLARWVDESEVEGKA